MGDSGKMIRSESKSLISSNTLLTLLTTLQRGCIDQGRERKEATADSVERDRGCVAERCARSEAVGQCIDQQKVLKAVRLEMFDLWCCSEYILSL